jgi:metal-responsive CopG/Arc/MetJ family transcriptional regulator
MPRPETVIPMRRLNLALPKATVDRIDRLMVLLQAASRTEIIRRAVEQLERAEHLEPQK